MKKLEGLIAAAHTAFNADGSVNYDVIPKQAAMLIKQKVTGVYVSGTTGEGVHCSTEERKRVMDAWVKAAKGKGGDSATKAHWLSIANQIEKGLK